MRVEPLKKYRRPKYPGFGENIQLSKILISRGKHKAIIAAVVAISGTLTGCGPSGGLSMPTPEEMTRLSGMPAPSNEMWLPTQGMYLSDQEIMQVLQEEAAMWGISFDVKPDAIIKYLDVVMNPELYNEEKKIGVEIVHPDELNKLYKASSDTEGHTDEAYTDEAYDGKCIDDENVDEEYIDLITHGLVVKGSLEDDQTADLFLIASCDELYNVDYREYEDNLREAFRQFIERLQAEGTI